MGGAAIIAAGQSIGFAIPSNLARHVTSQIKATGKVVRGWIGVSIQSMTPELAKALKIKESHGSLVSALNSGGPAEAAGIRRGDVIVSFYGKDIKDASSLPPIVADTPPGKTVHVAVIRNSKEMHLKLTVGQS
jgi:serine protease Do